MSSPSKEECIEFLESWKHAWTLGANMASSERGKAWHLDRLTYLDAILELINREG